MRHLVRQRLPAAFAGPGESTALPLDHDTRKRTRQLIVAGDDEIALALPSGEPLREGDVLVTDAGLRFRVVACAQAVLRACSADPWLLARAAYHLGNRHVPVAVLRDELHLEPDPVLRDLLESLGLQVDEIDAPFEPEAGAYAGGHRHGHDATFAEDHALAQAVFVRRGAGDP